MKYTLLILIVLILCSLFPEMSEKTLQYVGK